METLSLRKLAPGALMPTRDGQYGWDVHAYLLSETGRPNTVLIPPRTTRIVPTGLAIEPPPGFMILLCSRPTLASRAIFVANSPEPGGPLEVLLYNGSHESYYIKHEECIAHLMLTASLDHAQLLLKELAP